MFLSGFNSLVCEVVWLKMLAPVFGNTIYSSSIVISTFMAGIAAGGFAGGRYLGSKEKPPIRIFILSQFSLGIYIICMPFIITVLKEIYPYFSGFAAGSAVILQLLKAFLSFFIMIVPASLMGIAIPVITREIAIKSNNYRKAIGISYAVNTFGGAVGSFSTGFFFFLYFGIYGCNLLAGGLSLLVSAAAALTSRKRRVKLSDLFQGLNINTIKEREEMKALHLSRMVIYSILFLTFYSGFSSLGYEILWLRMLVPIMESTTYTFSIILTIVLFGLALGNFIYYLGFRKRKNLLYYVILFEVMIGVYSLCTVFIYSCIFDYGILLFDMIKTITWEKILLVKIILAASFLIIPTILFGMVLPIVSTLFSSYVNKIGRGVGDTFSLNMTGAILGSLLTGFIILPYFGVNSSLIVLGVINISAGMLLFFLLCPNKWINIFLSFFLYMILIWIIPVIQSVRLLKPINGEDVVYYKETVSGNVEVSRNSKGFNILRVDNKTHGGSEPWVKIDEVRIAHLPILMHENPKDILLIGLGTGITLDAVTGSKINSVDCIEIVGDLINTLPYFIKDTTSLTKRKGVNIIIEDGRSYILRAKKFYDVIIMDLIHPESAGAGSLFTKEYYEGSKRLLKENGLVAQWLPLYQLSPYTVKIIMHTFAEVFNYASLFIGSHNKDFPLAMLVGSNDSLSIEKEHLLKKLKPADLGSGLIEREWLDNFSDNYIMDKRGIRSYTKGVPVLKDNIPLLEFVTPKGLLRRNHYGMDNYRELLAQRSSLN